MEQNPDELMAQLAGQGAAPGAEGEMGMGMPMTPAPPPTRNPKVMRLELQLTNELLSRRRRDDLMPPESLMDTPNRVEFPILRAPREEIAPLPPAPMNFLDQMPGGMQGGMDMLNMEPEGMMDGPMPPDPMMEGAPSPVPGMGGAPEDVSDDPSAPPVDVGGLGDLL